MTGELLGGFSLTEPHAGSDAAAITTRGRAGRRRLARDRAQGLGLARRRGRRLRARLPHGHRARHRRRAHARGRRTRRGRARRAAVRQGGGRVPADRRGLLRRGARARRRAARAGRARACARRSARSTSRASTSPRSRSASPPRRSPSRSTTRKGRAAFGGTLLDLQAIQFALADVETDVVAGRLLYRAAAAALDEGRGSVLAAHAKRFCPDAALRAAIACSEVLGAYGLLHEYPLARFLAHAKMLQVVDGTTEVQRIVIARDLARGAEARAEKTPRSLCARPSDARRARQQPRRSHARAHARREPLARRRPRARARTRTHARRRRSAGRALRRARAG